MANSFGLSERISDAEAKCLSCGAPLPADRQGQQKFTGGHTSLLVLGGHDDGTQRLFENAKEAVKRLGAHIEVDCVKDEQVIAVYNVKKLPVLIINGSIVSQGIVSDVDSIIEDVEFIV